MLTSLVQSVHSVAISNTPINWGLGLWCLMPFLAIFQLYCGGSILLLEETRVPEENHGPAASHWQICIKYTSPWAGVKLTTLVVIGTDWIGSCKSNYHTITMPPSLGWTNFSSFFSCFIHVLLFLSYCHQFNVLFFFEKEMHVTNMHVKLKSKVSEKVNISNIFWSSKLHWFVFIILYMLYVNREISKFMLMSSCML